MQKPQLKTILVIGKPVHYLTVDDTNYILIRPLCEALGIDAGRQIRDLKSDDVLSGEVCEHTTRLPTDDQSRPYVCLPERFIYGWIFTIKFSNTMADETKANLTEYRAECYSALYDHFHGKLEASLNRIREKARLRTEFMGLQRELLDDPRYQRMLEIERLLNQNKTDKVKAEQEVYSLFEDEFRRRAEESQN